MSMNSVGFNRIAPLVNFYDLNQSGGLDTGEVALAAVDLRDQGLVGESKLMATIAVGGRDGKGLFYDPDGNMEMNLREFRDLANMGGRRNQFESQDFANAFPTRAGAPQRIDWDLLERQGAFFNDEVRHPNLAVGGLGLGNNGFGNGFSTGGYPGFPPPASIFQGSNFDSGSFGGGYSAGYSSSFGRGSFPPTGYPNPFASGGGYPSPFGGGFPGGGGGYPGIFAGGGYPAGRSPFQSGFVDTVGLNQLQRQNMFGDNQAVNVAAILLQTVGQLMTALDQGQAGGGGHPGYGYTV
ncbi:MAG: hypothetical protein SFZ03_00840 [Candidatus Melainabacteria bacterium]|nr:hypothetical protein [Candidatus Melainabacteria bacterium]